MSRFTPTPAVRTGQKARLAIAGPSGSGKSWTALEAATVLADGGPIVVVDTERGSASLYADEYTFDTIAWDPPFDPRELGQTVIDLSDKYAVVVVDSVSHFWMGEGGTLAVVDAAAAAARGNSYAGWKEGTPAQNDMIDGFLRARSHVIVTMRSKTEYVLEEKNGKQVPRKVGMAPVQRDGIEYEFTVTCEIDKEHTLLVDKTRCSILADRAFKKGHTREMAVELAAWLGTAEPTPEPTAAEPSADTLKRAAFDMLKARTEVLDEDAAAQVKAWVKSRHITFGTFDDAVADEWEALLDQLTPADAPVPLDQERLV